MAAVRKRDLKVGDELAWSKANGRIVWTPGSLQKAVVVDLDVAPDHSGRPRIKVKFFGGSDEEEDMTMRTGLDLFVGTWEQANAERQALADAIERQRAAATHWSEQRIDRGWNMEPYGPRVAVPWDELAPALLQYDDEFAYIAKRFDARVDWYLERPGRRDASAHPEAALLRRNLKAINKTLDLRDRYGQIADVRFWINPHRAGVRVLMPWMAYRQVNPRIGQDDGDVADALFAT